LSLLAASPVALFAGAPKAVAAAGDYISFMGAANPELRKYGGGASDPDLPGVFQNYHKAYPTGLAGQVDLYYDMNSNEAVYCSDITNVTLGGNPVISTTPFASFGGAAKQDLLKYVLYHGQKTCTPTTNGMVGDENVEMQIATQICVWMIAEEVYPGGGSAGYYPRMLDVFPPRASVGAKAKALMAGAVAYAANPQPPQTAAAHVYPSFTATSPEQAPIFEMTLTDNGYACELVDTNLVLAADWQKDLSTAPGSPKILDVKDSGPLTVDVARDGTALSNTMIVSGDPGQGGTTVVLESHMMAADARIEYLHTPDQNYQDMVRFARIRSSGSSQLLYMRFIRGEATSLTVSKAFADPSDASEASFTVLCRNRPVDLSELVSRTQPGGGGSGGGAGGSGGGGGGGGGAGGGGGGGGGGGAGGGAGGGGAGGGGFAWLDAGQGRFKLGGGASVSFFGLPFDTYSVIEDALPGYLPAVVSGGVAIDNGAEITLTADSPNAAVRFQNARQPAVSGTIRVAKVFENPADSVSMAFVLTNKDGDPVDLAANGVTVSGGTLVDGGAQGRFLLSHGQVATISGLPFSASPYVVTEEGYGAAGFLVPFASYGGNTVQADHVEVALGENARDQGVAFTNSKEPDVPQTGCLAVSKRFGDGNLDTAAVFRLTDKSGRPVDLAALSVSFTPSGALVEGGVDGRFALRHDESALICGLRHEDGPYTLAEERLPGYMEPQISVHTRDQAVDDSATDVALGPDTLVCDILFTNNRDAALPPILGPSLVLSKVFVGLEPDDGGLSAAGGGGLAAAGGGGLAAAGGGWLAAAGGRFADDGDDLEAVFEILLDGAPVDLKSPALSIRLASAQGEFFWGASDHELILTHGAAVSIFGLAPGAYVIREVGVVNAALSDFDISFVIDGGEAVNDLEAVVRLGGVTGDMTRVDFTNTSRPGGPTPPEPPEPGPGPEPPEPPAIDRPRQPGDSSQGASRSGGIPPTGDRADVFGLFSAAALGACMIALALAWRVLRRYGCHRRSA
jgi:hypothetical protein